MEYDPREPSTGGTGGTRGNAASRQHHAAASSFVRDPMGGGWTCPYCNTEPYHMRGPGFFSRDPPSREFVERHFALCSALSLRSSSSSSSDHRDRAGAHAAYGEGQRGPIPPHHPFVPPQQQQHQHQQGSHYPVTQNILHPTGWPSSAEGASLAAAAGIPHDVAAAAAAAASHSSRSGAHHDDVPHDRDRASGSGSEPSLPRGYSPLPHHHHRHHFAAGAGAGSHHHYSVSSHPHFDHLHRHTPTLPPQPPTPPRRGGGAGHGLHGLPQTPPQVPQGMVGKASANPPAAPSPHQAARVPSLGEHIARTMTSPRTAASASSPASQSVARAGGGGGGRNDRERRSRTDLLYSTSDEAKVHGDGGRSILGIAPDEPPVMDFDKPLLTDYFYLLVQQLTFCRFTERDRKSRGGKRGNITVGYGGLECRHCAGEGPGQSRKFFWANVDRLANSFSAISDHITGCPKCPPDIKDTLKDLKHSHREQMAKLPKGSQKVFFRRMWRRLHPIAGGGGGNIGAGGSGDGSGAMVAAMGRGGGADEAGAAAAAAAMAAPSGSLAMFGAAEEGGFSAPDSGSLRRQQVVAACARGVDGRPGPSGIHHLPLPPQQRVLLAIPGDKQWLSDMDCFVRRCLEVFCASEVDVAMHKVEKRYAVNVGQVGIRCVYCASSSAGASGAAVSYPFCINGIYEAVREIKRLHLDECPNLPPEERRTMSQLQTSSSLLSVLRPYYIIAAKALGMYDASDGIRSEGFHPRLLGSSSPLAVTPAQLAGQLSAEGMFEAAADPASVEASRQQEEKQASSPLVARARRREEDSSSTDADEGDRVAKKRAFSPTTSKKDRT